MSTPTRRPLDPAQRLRLRRLTRWTLGAVIAVEMVVIGLAVTPAADAILIPCTVPCPVKDSYLKTLVKNVKNSIKDDVNDEIKDANSTLEKIKKDQTQIRKRADQHSRELNDDWDVDLAAVTSDPASKLMGISYVEEGGGGKLATLMPSKPWVNYHSEYRASADTTLSTLRSSLDALHAHNVQIEKSSALDRIATLAGEIGDGGTDGKGHLAMDELEVQSSLEVARQLHALRSQYAIATGIYAVAEHHKTAVERRSMGEDEQTNCMIMASALGGMIGGHLGTLACDP